MDGACPLCTGSSRSCTDLPPFPSRICACRPVPYCSYIISHFGTKCNRQSVQSFNQIFMQSDELCKKRAAPGVSGATMEKRVSHRHPSNYCNFALLLQSKFGFFGFAFNLIFFETIPSSMHEHIKSPNSSFPHVSNPPCSTPYRGHSLRRPSRALLPRPPHRCNRGS